MQEFVENLQFCLRKKNTRHKRHSASSSKAQPLFFITDLYPKKLNFSKKSNKNRK